MSVLDEKQLACGERYKADFFAVWRVAYMNGTIASGCLHQYGLAMQLVLTFSQSATESCIRYALSF